MMPSRTRLPFCLIAALLLASPLAAADLDGSPPAVGTAEAARLYRYADDYVTNVTEGPYSYAYMQFYWLRAEAFVERAEQVYPDSPTAEGLRSGRLTLGPYSLDYFKERVLPRLQEKKVAAFDAVNCAIFLYGLDPLRWDAERYAAFDGIIEVLCRQQRWGEALAFNAVLAKDRPRLLHDVFQVAARYDERKIVARLLTETTSSEKDAAGFWPIMGEAMALLGQPRADIAHFLQIHPQDDVKLAVLRGMAEREVQIRRAVTLRLSIQRSFPTTHYELLNLQVRDNVPSTARQFFPEGNPEAAAIVAAYDAALGRRPDYDAPIAAHLAYLQYLADLERFDDIDSYLQDPSLPEAARTAGELKAVELFAANDRMADSERYRAPFAAEGGARADAAAFAQFRGETESLDHPLTVHTRTFASLAIKDPCVLAQAIMEESLRPNRSIRGAPPWDAVVEKFEPGFANLPLPKSAAVGAASSATNPY